MHISDRTVLFDEELTKLQVPKIYRQINDLKTDIAFLDLKNLKKIDSSGVIMIDLLKKKFPRIELLNVSESISNSLKTFSSLDLEDQSKEEKQNYFEMIGEKCFTALGNFYKGLILMADISYWSFIGLFNKKGQRQNSVIQQSLLIGVDALGIVGLLSFIIGLIMALQAAAQLRQFGANIFIADLVAISMVREMGPMMTAIIVAGRSGSSIASEIATMKVTEEIDALKMMAINPIRYVVVPKFHSITLCMPLLVMLATVIGIFGGLIVAVFYLDLSVVSYFNEIFHILVLKDVLVGLSKSIAFAWVIVVIGSYYGFEVKGGAEGVGKATTLSVVSSIFAVIILDALFSLLYLGR